MAGLLRAGEVVVARADRGAPRRRRARQPGAQRVAVDRSRPGARRGRRRRRPAGRGAGEAAHALDALRPLLGIPVALKDLVSVAGGQCTAGSRILEGYRCAVRRPHHRAPARGRARSSSARPTWTSSRWAPRPSTRPTARPPTRGTSTGCRAAAAAARRRRWRPITRRCRSGPTPAARSASRPRCAGSSA